MVRAGGARAGDRPGPPGEPRRPRAGRDVDALPGRRGVPGWMEAAGFDGRARRRARARLVPRPARARTRWRSAASSRAPGPSPAPPPVPAPRRRRAARASPFRFVAGSRGGRAVHPDRRRADAARPHVARERAPRVTIAATHARSNPLGGAVAVRAAAHDHRHRALGRRALPIAAAESDARRRRRRPAGHAGRRPGGQHRDRRRQPDHRRRDRPDQQAVAADRGGRPLARAARG